MSFTPGRKKTGGRAKGVKNKRDTYLEEKAKELGVDPFEVLLLFTKGDWKALGYESKTRLLPSKGGAIEVDVIEPDMRLSAAKEAATYLHAKKKSVEHSGQIDSNVNLDAKIEFSTSWGSIPKKDE